MGTTLFAKIRRPDAAGLMPRARLFRLLDSGRRKRIVWVTGPAGSGKTSLAAAYLAARGLDSLWYRADEGDADSATFYYYLGQAVRKASPRRRRPLPLFTPEYQLGGATFCRRFFEDVFGRLNPPFVIVIDNYQDVPDDSPFHDIVHHGLAQLPDGIQAIVLSRKEPHASFLRDRADNAMALIGWDALRFTPKESRKIVLLQGKRKLGTDIVAAVCREAEGWAAGLVLLAAGGGTERIKGLPPRVRPRSEVFDYIAGEVFDGLNSVTRDFLLAVAFFPSLTVAAAERVSARKDAAEILDELHRNNFFTARDSGAAAAYRFHPLFQAFLQARAVNALGKDAAARLQTQAARVLLDEGQREDAAALFCLAEDWEGMRSLVHEHAQPLIMQGRNRTLQEWIEKMPEEARAGDPRLLYWLGVSIMPFDPARSRLALEQALGCFESEGDEQGALLAWSGIVQTFLFEFHDFRPLDRWIDWIDERMRHGLSFAAPGIEASVVTGMTGILAWRRPDLPERGAWLDRALSLPHRIRDIDACMRAYTNSALYHVWMGEFVSCGLLIHEMNRMARSTSLSPLRLLSLKITEAMLYNASTDHGGAALRSVSEGLRIAEETGVHLMSPTLFLQGVFASLNNGDAAGADDFLRKTEPAVGEDRRINLSHYLFASAWRELAAGEKTRAAAFARKSLRLIEDAGAPFAETLIRLVLAHALHECGDHQEAGSHLERAAALVAQTGSAYSGFLHRLTEAHFAFERNERASAFAALRLALEAGRRNDFTTLVYFWRPGVMGRLCGEAIEEGIEADYAARLVRKLGLARDERTRGGEQWPWRLKVVTLGRFGLLRDGLPVAMSGKTQKKPLLMLKAMVSAGPGGIHRDRLIDALWPDAEGDAGSIALHTTLSRLRKLVGDDGAIQMSDGVLALDRRYCWVDAWDFEGLAERFEAIQHGGQDRRGGIPSFRLLADKAAALYKGIFLPADQDFLPAISARERMRSTFLRLLSRAGQSLELAGDFEAALDYYTRGLEAEPLAEELHYGRISCYLRLGRKAEAMTAYQRCRMLLAAELGVTPSRRTESLMQQLSEV